MMKRAAIIILLIVCCTITIGRHNTQALPGLIPSKVVRLEGTIPFAGEVRPPLPSGLRFEVQYRPWYIERGPVVGDSFLIWLRGDTAALNRIKSVEYQRQAPQSDRRAVAGVDERDEFDRTPLMRAAARGDLVAAKELLARGADVNAKTADDYTILMYAAFYGNAEIVEFLLDNGADVNARHKNGLTALIEAAKQNMDAGDVIANYIGTVEALLKKDADVNVRDKDGSTALEYAEKYGRRNKQEIVRLLRNAAAK